VDLELFSGCFPFVFALSFALAIEADSRRLTINTNAFLVTDLIVPP
jgi:hypothetical protein